MQTEELDRRLYGTASHLHLLRALEGIDHQIAGARPAGSPHSIFQILEHMSYWQEIALGRIRSEPHHAAEKAADGWPRTPEPGSEQAWSAAINRMSSSLRALEPFLALEDQACDADAEQVKIARSNLHMLRGHNAYHIGQIALLRQLQSCWPPPGGGETW